MLFVVNTEVRSLFMMSKCSSIFFKASEFFNASSFCKICLDLSRLSIRFKASFAREALNLIDNLERSKQTLQNDETLKNSDALKKMLEHFDVINKDLLSIFSKNNIKPIDSLNKKLDPNFHQAMMEIENDQKEPGTIVQEVQKGFTIKDRLLRPALVGVSKKPKSHDNKGEENKENLENK